MKVSNEKIQNLQNSNDALIEKLEEISNKKAAPPDGTEGVIEQNTDNPTDEKTKKFSALASDLSDLQQDFSSIKANYLNFLANDKDQIASDKTEERLATKQLISIVEDNAATMENFKNLRQSFDALRNKTNDKICNFSQKLNNLSEDVNAHIQYYSVKPTLNVTTNTQPTEFAPTPSNESNNVNADSPQIESHDEDDIIDPQAAATWTEIKGKRYPRSIKDIDIGSKRTLLIGDSIIQGLVPSKLDKNGNTFIKTIRGGTIKQIQNAISTLKAPNLRTIVCHVGTNDLQTFSPDEILEQLRALVNKIKGQFPATKVFFSEIIFRGTRSYEPEINEINEELVKIGKELNFDIIKNKNLQQPKFRHDGLHLNDHGSALLAINIKSKLSPSRRKNGLEREQSAQTPEENTTSPRPKTQQQPTPERTPENIGESRSAYFAPGTINWPSMSTMYGQPMLWPYPAMTPSQMPYNFPFHIPRV